MLIENAYVDRDVQGFQLRKVKKMSVISQSCQFAFLDGMVLAFLARFRRQDAWGAQLSIYGGQISQNGGEMGQ